MPKAHRLDLRVYYADTDAGGIVYHARYFEFAERARTEMLRHNGFAHAKLLAEQGLGFAVRTLSADYQAPAKLDDLLTMETEVAAIGGASMDLVQKVLRGEDLLATISLRLVCIDRAGKAARVPETVREIFKEG